MSLLKDSLRNLVVRRRYAFPIGLLFLFGAFSKLAFGQNNASALVVSAVVPPPGPVTELSSVTVTFSEPVEEVVAADFLINDHPADSVSGSGVTYTYSFAQPGLGMVEIGF